MKKTIYLFVVLFIVQVAYGYDFNKFYVVIDNDGYVTSTLETKDHNNVTPGLIEVEKSFLKGAYQKRLVGGVWFDIEKPKAKIKPSVFFDLFTDQQFEDIASSTNAKVKAFILKVRMMDGIDTESGYILNALNALESPLGLLGAGEATRIITEMQALAGE